MKSFRITKYGIALLSIFTLASCGSNSSSSDKNDQQVVVDDTQNESASEQSVIIIDVRTTEEFAEGHIEGAVNYNVEDGSLEAVLSDLDPNASYQVYCRTGRRSAIATDLMTSNGFSQVADLGSLEEAAVATGSSIVS